MGRFYRKLFELRHQGDYANIIPLDEVTVFDLIDEARRFVEQIEQIIREDSPDTSQEASP